MTIICPGYSSRAICHIAPAPKWKPIHRSSKSFPTSSSSTAIRFFSICEAKAAGEKRLRALRSIGVGGHINPGDSGADPYRQGLLREIQEEVILDSPYKDTCIGLINDDSLPVGQVHLGIVHVFELEKPNVRRREKDLTDAGFAPIAELQRRKQEFETWSQFVLDALILVDTAPFVG